MRWGLSFAVPLAVIAVACGKAETAAPPPINSAEPVSSPTAAPVQAVREGVWVEIEAEDGQCVRASLSSYFAPLDQRNCLDDGFVGYVTGGETTEKKEQVWKIAGQGWVLDSDVRFHHEGGFPYPPRPELAGAGLIAYIAEGDVWLINADGSQPRRLADVDAALESDARTEELAWSPAGDLIAVTVSLEDDMERTYSVLVVDLSGSLVTSVPNALLASWSPDGRQLALLAEHRGEREQAEPVCFFLSAAGIGVLDLETGSTTALTPNDCYFDGPEWSPDGTALLYTRDGDIYRYSFVQSQEQLVRAHGEGDWYWTVAWAPDSVQFSSFHHLPGGGNSLGAYEIIDPSLETPIMAFDDPQGGCGRAAWFRDWQPSWTADGRSLLYYESCGDPGFGGVWVADVSSGGAIRVAAIERASGADSSPDGRHAVFGADGFVWLTDIDDAEFCLLAEGSGPAWQPLPAYE